MGLFQEAVETYDNLSDEIGKYYSGKEPFAPVGHIVTQPKIKVTIDVDGEFVSASKFNDKIKEKVIIPVTQESSGRSSGIAPHPFEDKIEYLSGIDERKYTAFMKQLNEWLDFDKSNEKVAAVYKYLSKKSLISDLETYGFIKYDNKNKISNSGDLVCWDVIGTDDYSSEVWKDRKLMKSYAKFYENKLKSDECDLCMVSGEYAPLAKQHIKGVVSLNGNAKLISANDISNFTYRGRFSDDRESLTVSYIASQKAHNALKWLVANYGVILGERCFVCWNAKGYDVPLPQKPVCENDSNDGMFQRKKDSKQPADYKKDLEKALIGYKQNLPKGEDVVIAAFDAATTGRLAVTYYNELDASDYIDRLGYWDLTCSWIDSRFGEYSPSIYNIVQVAFGTPRESNNKIKLEVDNKLQSQIAQRLIFCRIDKSKFPYDIMRAAVEKSGNIQIYDKSLRNKILFTTCAIIKKYRHDNFKEECKMALEENKLDRSYQYGRLLAILEKAEKDTYSPEEKRESNAIRMQPVFVKRPAYAFKIIMEQLKSAYYPKLNNGARIWYDKLIGQIMEVISNCNEDNFNKPLSETYLLGYYLQKNALYTKNNDNTTEEK